MTTLQEAARLAIEALTYCEALNSSMIERKRAALNALRTALAQQGEQQPAVECACQTQCHANGDKETTCGSDQMRRAVIDGHAFRLLAAAPAPHDAAICCGVIIRQSLLHGV